MAKKAYSYRRFSSAEQQHGDSLRRQTKLAERYAAAHGLELDTTLTFEDLGVSAFRGKNAETGALRAFLQAVEVGIVDEGSYLLVESLDRISRRVARKAMRILEEVVEAGITLVTLSDGKAYTVESIDGMDFLIASITLIRANEESEMKSQRLKAVWEAKRATASTKTMTARTPGWIELNADRTPILIPDRAAIVRRIFELYLEGHGKETIARTLNGEGAAPFGRAKHWHRSYVTKILSSAACVGEFTPCLTEHSEGRTLRIPQEPIPSYYPAAVDRDTWDRAQALHLRNGNARGRHSGKAVRSLLAGLAVCPRCHSTMTRVTKGPTSKSGYAYFVCVSAKAGKGCEYKAVQQHLVEGALLHNPAQMIAAMPHSDADLTDQIRRQEAQVAGIEERIENVLDTLQVQPSAALRARLRKLEANHQSVKADLDVHYERASVSESKLVAHKADVLEAALSEPVADVKKINTALRSMLRCVVIDYRSGQLELHWQHGGKSAVLYTFP
ncbi:MAG: recombinase family protein [Woeseia sp.]